MRARRTSWQHHGLNCSLQHWLRVSFGVLASAEGPAPCESVWRGSGWWPNYMTPWNSGFNLAHLGKISPLSLSHNFFKLPKSIMIKLWLEASQPPLRETSCYVLLPFQHRTSGMWLSGQPVLFPWVKGRPKSSFICKEKKPMPVESWVPAQWTASICFTYKPIAYWNPSTFLKVTQHLHTYLNCK